MIQVSVVCLAYNHGKYISKTLDGFVSQKTNFEFEVIVHDDASTDDTADVIKDYAERYPSIIKPIYEEQNQYSKGVKIINDIIFPKINGKFVAFCEGDDFWCDQRKLQYQYDFLINNEGYSACVHNTYKFDMVTHKKSILFHNREKDISIECLLTGGSSEYQTSSLFCRKEYVVLPNEFDGSGCGDYPMSIYLAICGKIRFLPRVMSVYRYRVPGSWTNRVLKNSDTDVQIAHYGEINKLLNNINNYTKTKYSNIIDIVIKKNEIKSLELKNEYNMILTEYKDIIKMYPLRVQIRFWMSAKFPWFIKFRNNIRKLLNR